MRELHLGPWMLAMVAGVLLGMVGAPAAPRPVGPLSHVGRWLTDASGRAVILHGM